MTLAERAHLDLFKWSETPKCCYGCRYFIQEFEARWCDVNLRLPVKKQTCKRRRP